MVEHSQDRGKLALKAGFWYVVSSVMVRAISMITTPIFTRMMSTEEYGTVQTFTSWYTLLLPIFTLNLTYSIGRAKLDYQGKLDEYMGSMQILASLVSLCLSIIAVILLQPVASFMELSEFETVVLLLYLLFHISILMYQSAYRFNYKYKHNIAISWYTVIASTVLSILLILLRRESKADSRMLGLTIPTIILSLYFWLKSFGEKKLVINLDYWKYALKISVPLILHTVAMHILSQSDRLFITKIWGKSDTAFYSLAYTFGALLNVVTTAIGEGWGPWFHDTYFEEKYDEIRKNVKPLIILGCYIGLACVALAPEAILILGGSKYQRSVMCVPPIVMGVVVQYIYTHYVNIELHLKKTKYVSVGTIFAALFNIVTNAVFIPKFGFVVAAYTSLASYILLLGIHYFITKKVLHVRLYNDLFMVGAMVITFIVTGLIMLTYSDNVVRYILIGIGFISFIFYFKSYAIDWLKKKKTQKEQGGTR